MSLLDKFTRVVPIHYDLPYTDKLHEELLNEFRILHLVYHRNKNQHRVARWWSSLDLLHRHLRKILLIMEDIHEILSKRRLSSILWNENKKSYYKAKEFPSQKKVKRNKKNSKRNLFLHDKFTDDQGINLINKKLSLMGKEIHYITKQCIPSAYWQFMGVIELGQFSNLGFVLIGLTAKINSLLQKFDIQATPSTNVTINPAPVSIPDDGVLVDILPEASTDKPTDKPTISTINDLFNKPKKDKKKKSHKKKSKSIMDDIFG
ncbi:hypothetical protein CANINC_004478 [Pichia inconspicua]|uniref:RNase MRP protein 1 RNA binding domain-containing protein n=1 Tax=Pichia inconspicua TaxID=52247 RepID=A0A4T0WVE2_9ASCO|nr:hypothetical protein CANINC_004478 [[Candida] inconspicua]